MSDTDGHTTKSVADLEGELRSLQQDVEQAARALAAARRAADLARMEPLKSLVERAHNCLCPWNHTDGCGWGYEKDEWGASAHSKWLRHYDTIINGDRYTAPVATMEEVDAVITMVEQIKPRVRTAVGLLRQRLVPS